MQFSKECAEKIVSRIDTVRVGLEPSVIIALLLPLFQRWLQCLWDNDDTAPAHVKARIQHMHEKNPERLRRRVARSVYRQHSGRLSDFTCNAIADATIAEILELPDDAAERVAAESSL